MHSTEERFPTRSGSSGYRHFQSSTARSRRNLAWSTVYPWTENGETDSGRSQGPRRRSRFIQLGKSGFDTAASFERARALSAARNVVTKKRRLRCFQSTGAHSGDRDHLHRRSPFLKNCKCVRVQATWGLETTPAIRMSRPTILKSRGIIPRRWMCGRKRGRHARLMWPVPMHSIPRLKAGWRTSIGSIPSFGQIHDDPRRLAIRSGMTDAFETRSQLSICQRIMPAVNQVIG